MKSMYIEDVHNVLLGIGKEFHRICINNDIPYYMLGGTQLGAIRHKGFIPWDDDMDFGIPRSYFDKFIQCCCSQLNSPFQLVTANNSFYPMGYLKIHDVRTYIDDPIMGFYKSSNIGVYIDVFPLEDCSSDYSKIKKIERQRIIIDHVIRCIFEKLPHRKWYYGIVNLAMHYLLPHGHNSKMWWLKQKEKICMKYNITGNDAMINLYGIYKDKELISKEIWGLPHLYKFEDTEFYGPEDYDAFLKKLYNDYMQLPLEKDRHIHVTNVYWK